MQNVLNLSFKPRNLQGILPWRFHRPYGKQREICFVLLAVKLQSRAPSRNQSRPRVDPAIRSALQVAKGNIQTAPRATETRMSISIASATAEAAEVLRTARIAEPRREAGSLLSHALGRDRGYALTHPNDPIPKPALESFQAYVTRRAAGEPLQYITGHQEFFKLDFEVTPDVLIPRPETEMIVEVAMELLAEAAEPLIADIGTGSGCIAISLLHDLPHARAVAGDISSAALSVARRNAVRYDVIDRIVLIESDCFSAVPAEPPF